MRNFFTEMNGTPFVLFGPLHIFITLFTITMAILIFVYREKLKKFKYKEKVRYVLATILFTNMTIYYVSLLLLKEYDWRIDLPLHFCFITGYTFMYILVTGNKKLYSIVYFFTFVGPIPAMLWPDLKYTYDRFIFWQFVISHHFMILSSIYVLTVLEYKVVKSDILKAYVVGNLIVFAMSIFNGIFKTNYIMMVELPPHIYRIYPFVKYLPPIFWLESVGLFAMAIAYIPAYLLHRQERQKQNLAILEEDQELKLAR